ncbi:MAG: cytochrome c [Proteobacteria bacterium]|nr:cytochrome c [Pseudomonadota bacterium]
MSQKKSKPKPAPAPAPARVESEPTIAAGSSSAWPFVLLGVVLFGCFLYVENTGGAFRADIYQTGMKTPPPVIGESIEVQLYKEGAKQYAACAGCHQPNGLGSPALNFPPLAGSEWVLREKPDRMIRIMLDAIEGPVSVKGTVYDNPAMVPFREVLNDFQVAAIATFVRGNAEWGNKAGVVLPEQVKAIREGTASRGGAKWRTESLDPVP